MDLKEINTLNKNPHRHPWELARLRFVYHLLKLLMAGKSRANVLDIGSGDLYVTKELAQLFAGSQFYCVDKLYDKVEFSQENYIHTFSSLTELDINFTGPAHVVLMMDVIEHIDDETGFLCSLIKKPYITAETCFIITVPAFNRLSTSHDKYLGHYRRYSKKQLKEKLGKAGLSVRESSYFFFSLLVPRIFKKWGENISNVKAQPDVGVGNWKGGGWITKIIAGLLIADAFFCRFINRAGINFPGLSLYAICQKPA